MAQTNVQVPIERGHQHDVEVLEPRKVLKGTERYKSPGPSALAQDDKPAPLVLHHNSVDGPQATPGMEAPDMLYGEHITNAGDVVAGMPGMGVFKQHMSGRVDHGRNQGRNVGSEHLQMQPEPHFAPHRTGALPPEDGVTLPKDQ